MKQEKQTYIEGITAKINDAEFLMIADYGGLDVAGFSELRRRLGENNSKLQVVKNSFVKRAASEAGLPDGLADSLSGQTALVTGDSDVCTAAKTLKTFHKEFKKVEVKMGVVDGRLLEAAEIAALADLPSREVLLAQLLGVLNAPATKFARVLNEPASAFARVLQAKADQG
jgi:large subunit ribosomal protein L10